MIKNKQIRKTALLSQNKSFDLYYPVSSDTLLIFDFLVLNPKHLFFENFDVLMLDPIPSNTVVFENVVRIANQQHFKRLLNNINKQSSWNSLRRRRQPEDNGLILVPKRHPSSEKSFFSGYRSRRYLWKALRIKPKGSDHLGVHPRPCRFTWVRSARPRRLQPTGQPILHLSMALH